MALFTKKDELAEARALFAKRRTEMLASTALKAEGKAAIEQMYERDVPDEQIRRAEAAHRLVVDHHENLLHATVLAERKVQALEKAAADATEAKTRVKTETEIKRHVAALTDAQRSFDKACEALLAALTPVAAYVPEGGILINFAHQALAEIKPITDNIVSLAKSHAAAIVAGHAPAALATPEAPAPKQQPAPLPTTTELIAMTPLAWTEGVGVVRAPRGQKVQLPNDIAQHAMRQGAAAPINKYEASELHSSWVRGRLSRALPPIASCFPLDAAAIKEKADALQVGEAEVTPKAAAPLKPVKPTHTPQPRHAEKILSSHASPFTPMHREPLMAAFAAQRSPVDE